MYHLSRRPCPAQVEKPGELTACGTDWPLLESLDWRKASLTGGAVGGIVSNIKNRRIWESWVSQSLAVVVLRDITGRECLVSAAILRLQLLIHLTPTESLRFQLVHTQLQQPLLPQKLSENEKGVDKKLCLWEVFRVLWTCLRYRLTRKVFSIPSPLAPNHTVQLGVTDTIVTIGLEVRHPLGVQVAHQLPKLLQTVKTDKNVVNLPVQGRIAA